MKVSKGQSCDVGQLCAYVNDREAFVILQRLAENKVQRFSQLHARVGKTSTRTLTKRLRELEACGMISRQTFREAPPRVEYRLTPSGLAFKKVLHAMARWSRAYLPKEKRIAVSA